MTYEEERQAAVDRYLVICATVFAALFVFAAIYIGFHYNRAVTLVDEMYDQIERPLSITDEQIAKANASLSQISPHLKNSPWGGDLKAKTTELSYAISQARLIAQTSDGNDIYYQDGKIYHNGSMVDSLALQLDKDEMAIICTIDRPTPVTQPATSAETGKPISRIPNKDWEGPADAWETFSLAIRPGNTPGLFMVFASYLKIC